ncbi:hypothetical protein ACP26L_36340 (plasmid) [Paenibacillus sp. S-38]|uniref:hypothetical protein n=1 Tax=Paenibacillus sp. S-38 TaxID=3416710 RepID=UPI003CEB9443
MAGLANDYLIYPIMDLIKSEIKKNSSTSGSVAADPFAGTPSVRLFRDHYLDPERVTGALMLYESGYTAELYMNLGSSDMLGVPIEVDPEHPDWEYYTIWRLAAVSVTTKRPDGEALGTVMIRLNYDNESGALIGTTVTRI